MCEKCGDLPIIRVDGFALCEVHAYRYLSECWKNAKSYAMATYYRERMDKLNSVPLGETLTWV